MKRDFAVGESDLFEKMEAVGDYTLKAFAGADGKHYCVVVYEDDEKSLDIARTRAYSSAERAMEDGRRAAESDASKRV